MSIIIRRDKFRFRKYIPKQVEFCLLCMWRYKFRTKLLRCNNILNIFINDTINSCGQSRLKASWKFELNLYMLEYGEKIISHCEVSETHRNKWGSHKSPYNRLKRTDHCPMSINKSTNECLRFLGPCLFKLLIIQLFVSSSELTCKESVE